MKDVAIYNEANRSFITVFTFTREAYMKVADTCIDNEFHIRSISLGNKPGSNRFRIETTKAALNEALGE